jgi:transcriptional regulator with XRE-family HTH domain
MKNKGYLSDQALLEEIGRRVGQYRLNRNLTQAQLAAEAGISGPTLQRLEYGQPSQLTTLLRVLRALGLLENLEGLIPEPPVSPIQQAKLKGKTRRRASGKSTVEEKSSSWSWKDDA